MKMQTPDRETMEQAARDGDDGARIELGNRLLSEHPYGAAEHERGLGLLKQAAQGPRGQQAQWFLGAYFTQVPVRPDAQVHAAHWLGQAASAGFAPAIDRLADLHLQGAGVERSPRRALELQRRLADHGFQRAAWEAGYLMSQGVGDATETTATVAFARACALGYPPAYYSLGLRFVLGVGVARDGAFGRALLHRAADGGFPDAREAADELAPAAEFGAEASQWQARLKANLDSAPLERLVPGRSPVGQDSNPVVQVLEAHFAGVGHPALRIDDHGRLDCVAGGETALQTQLPRWEWLAERPKVGISRAFASREECAHLIHKMAQSLKQASEYRRSSSANDDAEVLYFSGRGQSVGAMQADSVVRWLEHRIATMTDWQLDALEPCSVIRYQPGEEYRPHVDYFSPGQIEINRAEGRDFGGQRIATFLLYLRVPEQGGETFYEHAGITVKGAPGMGVLHYNVTPDGSADEQSLHTGKPVRQGEKWLWRSTLRERCLYRAPQR
ncbi:2OG-Fe(II) oxygenase [Lysobacter sp. A289]